MRCALHPSFGMRPATIRMANEIEVISVLGGPGPVPRLLAEWSVGGETQVFVSGTLMPSWKVGSLLLVIFLVPFFAQAQATTGSAGTSSSPGGGYTVMGGNSSSTTRPQTQTKSPHIADSGGAPAEEVNRKALEQRAGSEGAKMLLRSVPNGAQVFVDGAFVGRTPLLLLVPPGKYKIQMRGQREAFGESTVGVAAKETREIALTLRARYPEHVQAR
jgi:hypothetical protein